MAGIPGLRDMWGAIGDSLDWVGDAASDALAIVASPFVDEEGELFGFIGMDDLKTAYKRNQNGMGVMYVNKNNEFVSDKFLPKNENEVINFYNLHSSQTDKIAIHLRFTTEGKTNKKNCHPFISYKKDNHFIGLMHNGPKLPIPIHNKNFSDTWHYNEYLKNLFQYNPKLIFNKDFQRELEEHIGTEKLIFLDSKSKQFIIINKLEGNYKGANWYSNEYWQDTPKISYLTTTMTKKNQRNISQILMY